MSRRFHDIYPVCPQHPSVEALPTNLSYPEQVQCSIYLPKKVIKWNRVIVFLPNLDFRHMIDDAISLLRLFAIVCVSLRFVARIGNTVVHCCANLLQNSTVQFAAKFDIVQFAPNFDIAQFLAKFVIRPIFGKIHHPPFRHPPSNTIHPK
jgi:hypothetical protein